MSIVHCSLAFYFTEGQVAAKRYSSLDPSQRGEILKVAYHYHYVCEEK